MVGARFSAPVPTGPVAHQASYKMDTGFSQGLTCQGVAFTTVTIVEVRERVELYLYSPSGHAWPFLG